MQRTSVNQQYISVACTRYVLGDNFIQLYNAWQRRFFQRHSLYFVPAEVHTTRSALQVHYSKKYRGQDIGLLTTFVDLPEAFNTVKYEVLWKVPTDIIVLMNF